MPSEPSEPSASLKFFNLVYERVNNDPMIFESLLPEAPLKPEFYCIMRLTVHFSAPIKVHCVETVLAHPANHRL
jgi:hypothetical protein